MCGTGANPPKCMGSAVYGPSGCTCPTCGALPCDQINDPTALETRFWSIVDRDGLTGLPSDMWAALETLVTRAAKAESERNRADRAERNRDMWKSQCERQADALAAKFSVTDAMEKAGVKHALSDSVHGGNGGWPGYVRRLWGAMNMARIAEEKDRNAA